MKDTSKTISMVARIVFPLAGFVVGFTAGFDRSRPPPAIVETIIIPPLAILVLPQLMVLVFRFNVAFGAFKPPWEPPSRASTMNPLSVVHLGSFVFAAVGVGATISIVWTGLAGVYNALLGFSGGIALHFALVLLIRRYTPPQD